MPLNRPVTFKNQNVQRNKNAIKLVEGKYNGIEHSNHNCDSIGQILRKLTPNRRQKPA
jgi:hypothetical protein